MPQCEKAFFQLCLTKPVKLATRQLRQLRLRDTHLARCVALVQAEFFDRLLNTDCEFGFNGETAIKPQFVKDADTRRRPVIYIRTNLIPKW